jgi:2-methylcitrate dehydratase PrpD
MLKDGSGWGAMAGTSAAYLAKSGFTGAPALTIEDEAVHDIWADLGERWRITEQYFKPWPVCRWTQPAVEATLAVAGEHRIAPGSIARIEVATFHEACRLAVRAPADTEQAQYSLPFPVAAAAARGRLTPDEVMGESLRDPEILALASAVELIEDDAMNAEFPARRFAEVAIVTGDGERFASTRNEARGDPENPLPDAEIEAKFRAYCLPSLGEQRTEALLAAITALGEDGDTAHLMRLLHKPLA